MHIILGSDKSGYSLRRALENGLSELGYTFTVFGPKSADEALPFYEVAAEAARAVQAGKAEKAILVCGTGMGVTQVAGKFKGIRAACVESVTAAKFCRAINDSNVMCMGGWFIAPELGIQMARAFLDTGFGEGLEDWRAEWLCGAKEQIIALEDEIYGGNQ